jgi:homocysteine S-methyltransferase
LTNTFGANRRSLKEFGYEGRVEEINRHAVRLARRAAGPLKYVVGSIGPAAALEPRAAAEQASVLVDADVDALLLETYRYPDVEPVLAEVVKAIAGLIPVMVSLWQWPQSAAQAARGLLELGASVIGMNCQPGMEAAIEFAERMDRRLGCPLLLKPSSRGTACPDESAGSFAQAVPRLVDHHVRFLGGCCGTSEVHVAALADACARLDRSRAPSLRGELC